MVIGFRFKHPNDAKIIFVWNFEEGLFYRNGSVLRALHRSTSHGELLYRFLKFKKLNSDGRTSGKDNLSIIAAKGYISRILTAMYEKSNNRKLFFKTIHGYGYKWLTEVEQIESEQFDYVDLTSTTSLASDKYFFIDEMDVDNRKSVYSNLFKHVIDATDVVSEKITDFVGRDFIFSEIESFSHSFESGYFMIEGDPGIGKTALMARLLQEKHCVHHFNLRAEGINRINLFMENICSQLIIKYRLKHHELPIQIGRDAVFLKKLLGELMRQLPSDEKVFILIDALDEVDHKEASNGLNTLVLPLQLPKGVFIIATTRRTDEVRLRVDCPIRMFALRHDDTNHLNDITLYIGNKISTPEIVSYLDTQALEPDHFVDEMTKNSEGNFMYLRHVLPEIAGGAYRNRPINWMPVGLTKYYEDHWWRMRGVDDDAWLNAKVPIVVALTIVREPVTLELIEQFSGVRNRPLILEVIRSWRQFLHINDIKVDGTNQKYYRIYHSSYQDYVKAKDEVLEGASSHAREVNLKVSHKRISDFLLANLVDCGILPKEFL